MPTSDLESPSQLLSEADRLLSSVVHGTRGLWPRTVAFLIRLALEQVVADFWAQRVPRLGACSMRAQMVCLREYADRRLAERAYAVWGVLSSACHYHSYELAPTAGELRAWHTEVGEIADALTGTYLWKRRL